MKQKFFHMVQSFMNEFKNNDTIPSALQGRYQDLQQAATAAIR